MKKNGLFNVRSVIIYTITIIICSLFIFCGYKLLSSDSENKENDINTHKAMILSVTENTDDSLSDPQQSYGVKEIHFFAKIKNGEHKYEIVSGVQNVNEAYMNKNTIIKKGDSVILTCQNSILDNNSGETSDTAVWQFVSYDRTSSIILLFILFFALILIIGKIKGLKTIISLVITCLSIFLIYIPATLKGYNIYLSTLIISVFIIVSSLILINGINKKTLCAVLGTISGVFVSALLSFIMNSSLKLTGFLSEEYYYITLINPDKPINLVSVVWGGIVIGALGAIMDVAMSIASSVHELSNHMQNKTFNKLFKSGMNIGKDAIGTMSNTLILAYIGSSFAMVLLLVSNNANPTYIFNTELIAVEICQSIIGSIGILAAVPITTAIGAKLSQ